MDLDPHKEEHPYMYWHSVLTRYGRDSARELWYRVVKDHTVHKKVVYFKTVIFKEMPQLFTNKP